MFSVFVLGTTVTILKDVFRILMEGEYTGYHPNLEVNTLASVFIILDPESV